MRPNQIISKVRKLDGDGSTSQTMKRVSSSAQAIEEEAITTTSSSPAGYEALHRPNKAKGVSPIALPSPWASSSATMTFVKEVGV